MARALHNLQLIKAALEGLRRLDEWESSEMRDILIRTRTSMTREKFPRERPIFTKNFRHIGYADPWGKEMTLFEWAIIKEACSGGIGNDYFKFKEGYIHVSTVWLGSNHCWNDGLEIFETMIFCCDEMDELNDLKGYQERYGELDEAFAGHEKAVELVKKLLEKEG